MNIKPIGIKVYQNTMNSARDTKKTTSTVGAKKEDTITISSHGMQKKEVREASAAIARELGEGVSKEKLDMLREQYQKGEYKPDEKLLANKLFNDLRI